MAGLVQYVVGNQNRAVDPERYAGGERTDVTLDARPSDAIAVALRVDCPILVSDDVLDEAGQPPEEFEVG